MGENFRKNSGILQVFLPDFRTESGYDLTKELRIVTRCLLHCIKKMFTLPSLLLWRLTKQNIINVFGLPNKWMQMEADVGRAVMKLPSTKPTYYSF